MPKVMRMIFPNEIQWDDTLLKFRYLGKGSDRIGHICPIGKTTAEWCLSLCEFAKTTPYAGGMQLVCAYDAIVNQSLEKQELRADPVDIKTEVADVVDWHLGEKRDVDEVFTFKPNPENPFGFTIAGSDPWELGLVEKPVLDPRVKRPKL